MSIIASLEDIPKGVPLIIFGTGRGGQLLKRAVDDAGTFSIVAFLDTFKTGTLEGLDILSLDALASRRPEGSLVLIAGQHAYDMALELRRRRISGWRNAYPLVRTLLAQQAEPPAPPTPEQRIAQLEAEVDALYTVLYQVVHNLDRAPDPASFQTQGSFAAQWVDLPDGEAMLSDPWFRNHVERIIAEEEVQVPRDWFSGKRVLDCGSGGGRWSYGLARLGASVTAVDVAPAALAATGAALSSVPADGRLIQGELENLDSLLDPEETFDLVWCWGVLHHCRSFTGALKAVTRRVAPGGVLYLYIYGREKVPLDADVAFFKQRVRYNSLPTSEARHAFLLEKADGDPGRIHQMHDAFAPLVSRRLDYSTVEAILKAEGFDLIERTKQHPELFIRALRGSLCEAGGTEGPRFLPDPGPPYWFERY